MHRVSHGRTNHRRQGVVRFNVFATQHDQDRGDVVRYSEPSSARRKRTIDVGVEMLSTVQSANYLGVCLNGELSMWTHIASVTLSAFYQPRHFRGISHLLECAITAQLFASFVLWRLDYCNVILARLQDVSIRPLQHNFLDTFVADVDSGSHL